MAGGADIPLAAFGFEIGEPFRYQYRESNARRQDPRAWDATPYAFDMFADKQPSSPPRPSKSEVSARRAGR
jgi:hypothetical protein